jgi:hypothetical protein
MLNSIESGARDPSASRSPLRRDKMYALVLASPVLVLTGLAACNFAKVGGPPQIGSAPAMTDSAGAAGGASTTINTAFAFAAPY